MPVPCAQCETPLPAWELAVGETATCTSCGSRNLVRAFPAILEGGATASRAESAVEGEASCYDHPAKRAIAACSQCGRFVCQLCSVEFAGGVWCPSCVAAGAGAAKAVHADTFRDLHDSTSLVLPLAALLFWPAVAIAAPASLVLTAMRWKRPISLVRRNRWRFVVAAIVATAEVVGSVWLIVYLILRARGRQ
jgi:hypothetical protein